MTQEQKQKLAERIAEKAMSAKNVTHAVVLQAVYEALNARDEEVEQLKDENTTLLNQCEEQRGFIAHLKAELTKAQNPWISVEDRLPEKADEYFVLTDVYVKAVLGFFSVVHGAFIHMPPGVKVTHWMPIPKGGEV